MNKDLNKSISSITYNYLNLPANINVTGKGTITYTYDAAGNKLKKVSSDNTVSGKTILTTTEYIAGFVYESKQTTPANIPNDDYSNRLQFMGQEEGRIRALYNNATLPNNITGFAFDYMIKDHLGNVRMVLTDQLKTDIYPVATLEGPLPNATSTTTSLAYIEKDYYTINSNYIVAAPPDMTGAPNAPYQNNYLGINNNPNCTGALCTSVNSTNAYKLNANTNKIGLGITLKVMSGDMVNISVKSYHKKRTPLNSYTDPIITLLLGEVLNAFTSSGIVSGKGLSGTLNASNTFPPNPNTFFTNQPGQTPSVLKAFINYIIFDEQFKYVTSGFPPAP